MNIEAGFTVTARGAAYLETQRPRAACAAWVRDDRQAEWLADQRAKAIHARNQARKFERSSPRSNVPPAV